MDDSTEFPPREAKTFLPFKFPGPSQSLILYTYPCLLHLNFPSSCALRLSRCSFSKLSQHLTYIFRWPLSKENLTLMYHRFLYFLLSHICHSYHKSIYFLTCKLILNYQSSALWPQLRQYKKTLPNDFKKF